MGNPYRKKEEKERRMALWFRQRERIEDRKHTTAILLVSLFLKHRSSCVSLIFILPSELSKRENLDFRVKRISKVAEKFLSCSELFPFLRDTTRRNARSSIQKKQNFLTDTLFLLQNVFPFFSFFNIPRSVEINSKDR